MAWLHGFLGMKKVATAPAHGGVAATLSITTVTAPAAPSVSLGQDSASGTDIHFTDLVSPAGEAAAVPVEVLLERVEPLVQRLYHEIGWVREEFDAQIRPVVRRYAEHVYLVPASESHHHARFGGLLVHGLEVAIEAARLCRDGVVDLGRTFQRDIQMRASRKRLWPVAAALGGMMHDLGKVLVDILVSRADTGDVWNPYDGSMCDWMARDGVRSITVAWRRTNQTHKRHEPLGLVLTWPILGADIIRMLNSHGRDIFEGMLLGALGEAHDPTGLGPIIRTADAASLRRDRDSQRKRWREGAIGGHPTVNRLLEAFHGLIADGIWKPNTPGNPVWVTPEGVFLVWAAAVANARGWLRENSTAGSLPNDPNVLADYLIDSKIAKPRLLADGQLDRIWMVFPPSAGGFATGMATQMLLISEPNVIFAGRVAPDPITLEIAEDRTVGRMAVQVAVDETVQVAADEAAGVDGEPAPVAEPTAPPPVDRVAASAPRQPPSDPSPAQASMPSMAAASPVPAIVPAPEMSLPGADDARVYFASLGLIGDLLLRLLPDYARDPDHFGNRVCYRERKLLLRWPDSVDGYGSSAAEVVKYLSNHSNLLATSYRSAGIDPNRGSLVVRAKVNNNEPAWPAIIFSEDVSRYAFVLGNPRPARDQKLRIDFTHWLLAQKDKDSLWEKPARVAMRRFAKDADCKDEVVASALEREPSFIMGQDGPEADRRIDPAIVSAMQADIGPSP